MIFFVEKTTKMKQHRHFFNANNLSVQGETRDKREAQMPAYLETKHAT